MTLLLITCALCLACRRSRALRLGVAACLLAMIVTASGCQWLDPYRGEGFQGWSSGLGSGIRGDTKNAKSSGFFFDRRASDIEKSLGGGF